MKEIGLKILKSKLYAKWVLRQDSKQKIITYEFPDDNLYPDDPLIYKKK
jgi:hypothetical protein